MKHYKMLFFAFLARLGLIRIRPKDATFIITNNCNSKCITCNQWKENHKNELNASQICGILKDLKKYGIQSIGYTGGEVLVRSDLLEIVKFSKKLNFYPISLGTNCLLLETKYKITDLIESGISHFSISLDGIHTHDSIRGVKGNYTKVIASLKILQELKSKYDFSYHIAMTLMQQTSNQIFNVLKIAKQYEAQVQFNLIDRNPYFFKNIHFEQFLIKEIDKFNKIIDYLLINKEGFPELANNTYSCIKFIKDYFNHPEKISIPCYLGLNSIYIDSNGNLYPSCWVFRPVGNLLKNSLDDLIKSKDYSDLIKKMLKRKCPGCTCGCFTNLGLHLEANFLDKYYSAVHMFIS